MNDDLRRLLRWLGRSQPPRGALLRALLSGLLASLTSVGLFVGAVALLVVSATRPGLRAVAGVLIVIELFAFLRSPIRFNERLSAHRLGFRAVTRWRKWLVASIGLWDFRRWRTFASGDLLERSLRDTDELQDLWLRCVLPGISSLATALVADVVIGLLPPRGQWWTYAGILALLEVLGVAGLLANFGPLVRTDRSLRQARGAYQATLVELSAVAPELSLLDADEFVERRSRKSRDALHEAEQTLRQQRRASNGVAFVVGGASLAALAARHPATSPTWIVVVALLALSSFETLSSVRHALDTAVSVSAAADRLEDLEAAPRQGRAPWPSDTALHATGLTLREDEREILSGVTFSIAPGRRVALTGPSGSGKSTLLRALAALDSPDEGVLRVGPTPLMDVDEDALRRHLIYLPSEPGLTRGFAHDVVLLGRTPSRDVDNDLRRLGIDASPTTRWDELSRGERQRVTVARAMATSPSIYLLDEPTSGLGRDETLAVLSLLEETGATVIVATHDADVMDWCDEVLELRERTLGVLRR